MFIGNYLSHLMNFYALSKFSIEKAEHRMNRIAVNTPYYTKTTAHHTPTAHGGF